MSNYMAKFKLSNYINSRVVEIENDDGVKEKGIFIETEEKDEREFLIP